MSRKARQDQSTWLIPSLYAFVGGYGSFKAKDYDTIDNTLIWLCNSEDVENYNGRRRRHAMYPFSASAQKVLLQEPPSRFGSILVMDVKDMFESEADYEEALSKEMEDVDLSKRMGKKLMRLFQKLLLQNAVLAASGNLCPILLKLFQALRQIDPDMISEVWLVHPELSTAFVNTHLVNTSSALIPKGLASLNIIRKASSKSRVSILKHYFPIGVELILEDQAAQAHTTFSAISSGQAYTYPSETCPSLDSDDYDPDYCNSMGSMLFMSLVKVEMNPYTKQYERNSMEITSDLMQEKAPPPEPEFGLEPEPGSVGPIDWTNCERQVGALVLRGNRCVLVRSLEQKWRGMRIPSVVPLPDEPPLDAATRAVVEFTGVDAAEVRALDHLLPVSVYAPQGRPILVHLYPLYTTAPPPDGPLEDADLEDDETPYDWYTLPYAMKRLDKASIAALQTMSLNLVQAANVGLVPAKWGGVFGHELHLLEHNSMIVESSSPALGTGKITSSLLDVTVEEWTPSRQGDVLQDVRKANNVLKEKLGMRKQQDGIRTSKLPVTLLSGFLGSGKTTLLSHILSNYDGLKVAILVNDMGAVNIDAALIKSTVSIRQREEHMVELSNGCICCTLREDLLVEVANIAADTSFDYLLIESTGISEPMPVAETFTFEDSGGLKLGDVAEIDTLVTVVDGSRFFHNLDSLDSLQERNWHADPEDQRTISHLLCDQVEFANVVVLNKCDLLRGEDRTKVRGLIEKLNPKAKLIESEFSNVPLDCVLGTGLFSMTQAEQHEGWLQEARLGEHKPETEEYGIGSFTFRANRPFLPHKLENVLISMLEQSEAPFDVSHVLRSKGFIWLANCPQLQGDFSLAGNHYSLLPGNPWWAEIDKSHWPENLERDIAPLWDEKYGDRQQEIVVIGQDLDQKAISQALEECLVPLESMESGGQEMWYQLVSDAGDPFGETWDEAIALAQKEHDHHGHDHSHEHQHNHVDEHKEVS